MVVIDMTLQAVLKLLKNKMRSSFINIFDNNQNASLVAMPIKSSQLRLSPPNNPKGVKPSSSIPV